MSSNKKKAGLCLTKFLYCLGVIHIICSANLKVAGLLGFWLVGYVKVYICVHVCNSKEKKRQSQLNWFQLFKYSIHFYDGAEFGGKVQERSLVPLYD